MNWLRAAAQVSQADETEQKYLIHEVKYALLAAVLFIIFSIPWIDSLIRNTFPSARGPMMIVYKVTLLTALYYIIQKTDWFQSL